MTTRRFARLLLLALLLPGVPAHAGSFSTGSSSAGVGTSVVCSATITLTDAQIKALPTTSVEIIATPGVGRVVMPLVATVWGTIVGAYTNIGARAQFYLGNTPTAFSAVNNNPDALRTDFNTVFGQSINTFYALAPAMSSGFGDFNAPINSAAALDALTAAIRLAVYNGDAGFNDLGNLTGGHFDNTLTGSVLYSILTLATGVFAACP